MPIEIPKIDDRSYREILNDALARIRVYNPEWTNFNESDPGVTLLELFAFMTENLLYRSNQIPERNRRKFLSLLGVPMQPATPARGIVTFANVRGSLESLTLAADLEVLAGQLPFRTQDALDVLPVEAKVYYKRTLSEERQAEVRSLYAKLYGGADAADNLAFYETTPLEPPVDASSYSVVDLASDTVDDSLWVALLARPRETPGDARPVIAGRVLSLGVLPEVEEERRTLHPVGASTAGLRTSLVFEIATDKVDPATGAPLYDRLQAESDADVLGAPGVVKLRLPGADQLNMWEITEPLTKGTGDFPPSLEDDAEEDRIVTWIRIRLSDRKTRGGGRARIGWVGINAARVVQQTNVVSEIAGRGTGEPDQAVSLVHKPVISGSVRLTVDGVAWEQIDDLFAAGPEVPQTEGILPHVRTSAKDAPSNVFTLDHEAGVIRFGDGLRGARPPLGAVIRVSYAYGGGQAGNLGIGAISKAPTLPSGVKVTNPLPTWGGDDAETVDEAERNIPAFIRHKDRLVSLNDFEEVALRTPGVDIGRLEVLPTFHPDLPDIVMPGVVTLLAIPKVDRLQPDAPVPDNLFLDAICRHIEPRRLVTTEVHVRGPKYKPVHVSVGIETAAGRDFPPVRDAVAKALKRFLSPLYGGREGEGWPRGRAVIAKELWAEAARVDGVAFVNELLLIDASGVSVEEVSISGLELPRLLKVGVAQGEPELPERLLGGAPDPDGASSSLIPVPVVPDEC